MKPFGRLGQGESLIKVLVVAIIAVIAIALAKSYFRESSKTVESGIDIIRTTGSPSTSIYMPAPSIVKFINTAPPTPATLAISPLTDT